MHNRYKFVKFIQFIFILIGAVVFSPISRADSITNYIAQPNFPPHTLSTGEFLQYSGEGGNPESPLPGSAIAARQYKNDNWEQFFSDASGVYRREDTSWQIGGRDPICAQSGNRAYFAMDSSGTVYADGIRMSTGGTLWLPNFDAPSSVGQTFNQGVHQVFTADAGVPPGTYSGMNGNVEYCALAPPDGVTYNYAASWPQNNSLTITGYYEPYTFQFCSCTENCNPAPVITFTGGGGAGAGEGFAYMQDCGLVGFDDGNFRVGLVEGCGLDTALVGGDECSTPISGNAVDVPITFYGQVRTSLPTLDDDGRSVSEAPVRGAAIALYEGTREVDSGNEYGLVHKYSEIATDGNGEYVIQGVRRAFGGSHDNAIWLYIFCGNVVVDRWKMDLTSEYRRKDFSVACASNNYDPAPIPPNSVQLNAIGPQLQCAPGNTRNYSSFRQRGLGPGQTIPIPLLREDIDEQFLGCDDYPACLPPSTVYPTNEELLGRTGISRVSGTYDTTFAQIMGTYGIGPTNPWLKGQEDPAMALHLCEKARYANATLSEDNDPYNTNYHQQYGFGSTLSDPGLWERLYATKDLQEYACLDNNGTPVKWCEIEPPNSFSNARRQPTCGDFKLHSDYFPYLALIGDPYQGSNTHGVFEPTDDSYTPDHILDASRDERFQDSWFGLLTGDKDQPYASEDVTFWPGGKPEFSKNSVQIISDSAVAEEEGLDGALGGVFSTPFEEFGYNSVTRESNSVLVEGDTTTSNVTQTGIGDYQIRPYEMCTCSANDHTCTAEFNNFVHNDERHDWVGTYRYLTDVGIASGGSGGFFSRLCSAILSQVGITWTEINACSIATLVDKERTDLALYGGAPEPAAGNLLAQIEGVTLADWTCRVGTCTYDPNGVCIGVGCGFVSNNPTCVPLDWRSVSSACWNNAGGFQCRVYDCIEQLPSGDWGKCIDVSGCSKEDVCGETPSTTCIPAGPTICAWEIEDSYGPYGTGTWAGNGACIGDLIAAYASVAEYWAYAGFNFSPSLASLESALMFFPPFETLSLSGTGSTSDEPVMWERDTNRATQAFNATGQSGAPVYNGFSMYPVADIYYNSNLTPPAWGDPLPDPTYQGTGSGQAGTGNNGGTSNPGGNTGGSCSATGGGDPEPLDPPWEGQTNFPETGEITRYGVGLFEQVWQNRVAWGQVTPCPECYTTEGWQRLIATKRVGDINRRVCLNIPSVGSYGPFLVADVARQDHAACLEGRGWVADLDYDSFVQIANSGGYSPNAPIFSVTIDEATLNGGTYVCP